MYMAHFAALGMLVAACSSSPGAKTFDAAVADPGPAARDHFRTTFVEQRFADLPAALDRLVAADAARPDDPDTVLLLGLANLWGIAEAERDPAQGPLVPARGQAALTAFNRARALRPDDARVLGWLGGTMAGAGAASKNQELFQQGLATIEAGVQAYPEFNLFVHSLAYQQAPRTSPEFASAVDAYFRTLDLCFHAPVDRKNPDATPFLALNTQSGRERVCWNDPVALHNFEGFFLYMGDTLVKAGQLDAARVAYRDAKLLPDSATWPFRNLLDERLATIDARAALYADADPANDPPLLNATKDSCAACHAR